MLIINLVTILILIISFYFISTSVHCNNWHKNDVSALNRNVIITAMRTQWIVLPVFSIDSRQSGPKRYFFVAHLPTVLSRRIARNSLHLNSHIFFFTTYYTYLVCTKYLQANFFSLAFVDL